MLEIDELVQQLDEKDKLREKTETVKHQDLISSQNKEMVLDAEISAENVAADDEDEEETIGKAGNFSTVEELIA